MGIIKYRPDNLINLTMQERCETERSDILTATQIERDWYKNKQIRFSTEFDRDKAIRDGNLIQVLPNNYFGFSADIRNQPTLQYLNKDGLILLQYLMQELDRRTNFCRRGIKLILTSLHRCDSVQEELNQGENWYMSAPKGTSSHATGAAFDINIRTHYVKYPNEVGWLGTWRDEAADKYAPDLIEDLAGLLAKLSEAGLCNVVTENMVTETEFEPICFHVCAAPNVAQNLQNTQ